MTDTDEAVGRLEEVASGWSVLSDDRGRASGDIVKVLAALARVTEERDTAQREAGAFRVAVSLALGPCAPEHEGTLVVEAIQRMREDLATLRERLAGEVGALREADWPFCGHKADLCDCWARNAMLDRAVAVIRGEGT